MRAPAGASIVSRNAPPASAGGARRWAAHAFTAAALLLWFLYSLVVPAYQLPGPLAVGRRMVAFFTDPVLTIQLITSLWHVASALTLSFLIGLAVAMAARYAPVTRLLIDSIATPFWNAFSGIGWLFLGILWFGVTSGTVIFAVTMILIPFAIINIRTGLQEADTDLEELGKSLTRARWRQFFKVTVPMLLPYLFATLRTSFGVAWKVVLTAELFGGSAGVGYVLNVARQEFDTETIFAVIGFIIVFVIIAEKLFFGPIQRRLDRRYAHAL